MSRHANALLARLPGAAFAQIAPLLTEVELPKGTTVAEPDQKLTRALFPHSGILSLVVDLPGGGGAETGLIGRDGVFGALHAMDDSISLNRVTMQVAGSASAIPVADLSALMLQSEVIRKTLVAFELFVVAQTQQNVACNAHHTVQQKLCKWLLRMHDLQGPELPLTQEFIAVMLGVRRTSVSEAAQALQHLGVIDYARGHIRVLKKHQLEAYACECAQHIRDQYSEILEPLKET